MKNFNPSDGRWIFGISFLLFFIFLPLSISIDYMQNDDWNRYTTVASFMNGNFRLLDVTATTFYTQGFIGAAFAKLFSLEKLPVLTLAFGCANFFIFSLIVNKFFRQDFARSLLLGLVLFFNPFHFYSLFGFMTEVYLLTFCLASVYFYLNREFLPVNVYWILGFFAKQWAIVFPAAFIAEQIWKRKFKQVFFELLILIAVLVYYFYFFPKTQEMTDQKSFETQNYKSIKYILTHAYAYFVYLTVFSLPIILSFVVHELYKIESRLKIFGIVALAGISTFVSKVLFNQTTYPWKNFPLYPNIFTDKGFFLQGMEGEAHTNVYSPLIYSLDEIGLFFLILAGMLLLLNRKIIFNYEIAAIMIGFVLIVGTPFVFDRYLLVFIPVVILYLLRVNRYKFRISFLVIFLVIQAFISLDYGLEYMNRQKLIWDKSVEIRDTENIPPEKIISSHAWNKYYKSNFNDAMYWFRYSNDLPNPNEKVASEFWTHGIFVRTNIDIIRIQNR